MTEIIRTDKLVKNYYRNQDTKNPDARIEVLKGLDIAVNEGEYVCIMGSSGGGKTTLLKILGMMESITDGKFYFKGRDASDLWKDELADIRRREIGFVFQDFYLMDSLSVGENIMVPMILDKAPAAKMKEKMYRLAGRFGVEKLLDKAPKELSGGEKQRIAICRALINDPDVIMADEPTGNLDARSSRRLMETFDEINQDMKKNILLVTHDPKIACSSNKIFFIDDGVIASTLEKRTGILPDSIGRYLGKWSGWKSNGAHGKKPQLLRMTDKPVKKRTV